MNLIGILFLILSAGGWLHQRLMGYTWNWSQLGGWHHETLIATTWIIGLILLGIGWTVQRRQP